MNVRLDYSALALTSSTYGFPTASELAAVRAWYLGFDIREAVFRYLDASLTRQARQGQLSATSAVGCASSPVYGLVEPMRLSVELHGI